MLGEGYCHAYARGGAYWLDLQFEEVEYTAENLVELGFCDSLAEAKEYMGEEDE